MKIGQKPAKIGPLDSSFLPLSTQEKSLRSILLRSLQAGGHLKNPGTKPITTTSQIKIATVGTAHLPAKFG